MTIGEMIDAGYAVAVTHMTSLGLTHHAAVKKVEEAINGTPRDPSRPMTREEAARANQAAMARLNELVASTR